MTTFRKYLYMFILGRNDLISARFNITCAAFSLCRGVNISVLRHEAEFYGITPLGTYQEEMEGAALFLAQTIKLVSLEVHYGNL